MLYDGIAFKADVNACQMFERVEKGWLLEGMSEREW